MATVNLNTQTAAELLAKDANHDATVTGAELVNIGDNLIINGLSFIVDADLQAKLGEFKISADGSNLSPDEAKAEIEKLADGLAKTSKTDQLKTDAMNWKKASGVANTTLSTAEAALKAKFDAAPPDASGKVDGKTFDEWKAFVEGDISRATGTLQAELQAYAKAKVMSDFAKKQADSFEKAYNEIASKAGSKPPQPSPAGPQTPQTPSAGKAMGGGGKAEDYGYGQNPGFGMPQFNPVAMAGAKFMDEATLEVFDIQSDQKKRQQMMQLFFFYAKMAMSGDIGAMYQFMRFIGFIIGRDKAMQNVWMGTKLIQLQEVSRQGTQRLLNMDVKENDHNSQIAWQKALQGTKAEENVIATSQKLIGQMMEEFTQIVELLTNVQKSLLDVNGKLSSNLSVWR